MLLSIIIVNYNVKYFLEHCLLSILASSKHIDTQIIVVDNCSTDGSQAYLQHKFNTVTFFWQTTNLGFGKANNAALGHAKGKYVLFLNPDTIVGENCFTECISFLESHPQAGAVGVRMINGSGHFLPESKRGRPTALGSFYKIIGWANIFKNSAVLASYYAGHIAENEQAEVDILAGAFMMLTKQAVQATGGFDEQFFMYGEDIDLSYSLKKAGLKNYYLGTTTLIHFKGESTQKKSNAYIKHFYGAMLLFVNKHYATKKIITIPMKLMINIGMALGYLKSKFTNINEANKMSITNACIVGSAPQISLLEKALAKQNILCNHLILEDGNVAAEAIIAFANKNKTNHLVLCQGAISNTMIIEVLPKLENINSVYFYENGAQSIISSYNKNTQGKVITNVQ